MTCPSRDIFPQAAPMTAAHAVAPLSPQPSTWSLGGNDSASAMNATPFFLSCWDTIESASWPVIGGTLKKHGVVVVASLPAFEAIPPAERPIRIAACNGSAMIPFDDFTTADAALIACEDERGVPAWPVGCHASNLGGFVASLRSGVGGTRPIGLSINTATHPNDLRIVLNAAPDFIVLHSTNERLAYQDLICLRKLAEFNNQSEKPVTILAKLPCETARDFFIAIVLGATAISIDQVIQSSVESNQPPGQPSDGLLSSLGIAGLEMKADAPKKTSSPIDRTIARLNDEITRLVLQTGASNTNELDASMLRTTSPIASQSLGIPGI